MKFLIILALIVAAVVFYAMKGRTWLKTQGWAQGFMAWIEPIEIALYKKSETLLVGRLMWFSSGLVTFYDTFSVMFPSLDWTPVTSRVLAPVPDDLRGIIITVGIGSIGLLMGWLRKRTAKPIELVAAPTTPATVVAEAKVEQANAEAVATVEAAKA